MEAHQGVTVEPMSSSIAAVAASSTVAILAAGVNLAGLSMASSLGRVEAVIAGMETCTGGAFDDVVITVLVVAATFSVAAEPSLKLQSDQKVQVRWWLGLELELELVLVLGGETK
jgi:hypothetical protein